MPMHRGGCHAATAAAPARSLPPLARCHAPAAPAAAAWLLHQAASGSHGKALTPTWRQSALCYLQVCLGSLLLHHSCVPFSCFVCLKFCRSVCTRLRAGLSAVWPLGLQVFSTSRFCLSHLHVSRTPMLHETCLPDCISQVFCCAKFAVSLYDASSAGS